MNHSTTTLPTPQTPAESPSSRSPTPALKPSPAPVRGLLLDVGERPTGSQAAAAAPGQPALDMLDHRTRVRIVPLAHAGRGHHLCMSDEHGGGMLPLPDRITHIGRGLLAQVRLDESHVSRDHAILVRHGEHMRVLDNRSANRTFVNGRRVLATTLTDGDVIQVGAAIMRYVRIA